MWRGGREEEEEKEKESDQESKAVLPVSVSVSEAPPTQLTHHCGQYFEYCQCFLKLLIYLTLLTEVLALVFTHIQPGLRYY